MWTLSVVSVVPRGWGVARGWGEVTIAIDRSRDIAWPGRLFIIIGLSIVDVSGCGAAMPSGSGASAT